MFIDINLLAAVLLNFSFEIKHVPDDFISFTSIDCLLYLFVNLLNLNAKINII